MKHFLLFYEVSSDYLERRPQFRAEHLKLAWEAQERGEIVVAGALADPPDGSEQFFNEASSTDKTLKLYEGYYHDLLNDLGRETVFEDIDGWISERLHVRQEVSTGPAVLA